MTFLLLAFTLGLTGSLHCVGMCGPLMLAAAGPGGWRRPLAYQAGRLTTYVLLGLLLGGLGLGLRLWNAQGFLAILAGGLLLAFAYFRVDPGNLLARLPAVAAFQLRLRTVMARAIGREGWTAHFGLGVCNGFVPCGLVYLAVVGATGAGSPVAGAGFMLAFGLGTLPLLVVTLLAGRRLVRVAPRRLALLGPYLMAAAGLLLLWRGWVASVPLDFYRFQELVFPPTCH